MKGPIIMPGNANAIPAIDPTLAPTIAARLAPTCLAPSADAMTSTTNPAAPRKASRMTEGPLIIA